MTSEQREFLKGLHKAANGVYIQPVMERYGLTWLQAQRLVTLWVQQGCRG